MSFCMRSITTGGKFVVAQGCAVRRLSSRQLPKPVTSTFLNEFLGPIVYHCQSPNLDNRDDYKSTYIYKESINSTYSENPPLSANFLLDNYDNYSSHHIQEESFSQEISRKSNINSSLDLTNHSYNIKPYDSQISVTYQENDLMYPSHRLHVPFINKLTKDGSKVTFSSLESPGTLGQTNVNASSSSETTTERRPTKGDLEHIFNTLSVDLPKFFVKSIDYRIYHPQIEFVNNIKGTVHKGIVQYIKQVQFLKIIGHLKFAYVKLDVLKITIHTHDNTIRVRWRIRAISQFKVFVMFWKFKFWKIKEAVKDSEIWYDGFSTFHVGEDGLVYKHVADKMMPDQEIDDVKPKNIPSKLASQLTFSSLS